MTVCLVFDLFETELDREHNSGSIDGGIAYQYYQQLITPPPRTSSKTLNVKSKQPLPPPSAKTRVILSNSFSHLCLDRHALSEFGFESDQPFLEGLPLPHVIGTETIVHRAFSIKTTLHEILKSRIHIKSISFQGGYHEHYLCHC